MPLAVTLGCAVFGTVAWMLAERETGDDAGQPAAVAPPTEEVVVRQGTPAAVEPVRERRRAVPEESGTDPGEIDDEQMIWDIDPLHPDVSGVGDAHLRVRLVDADSGEPVDAWVRLWRLGVPETATLTAGDAVYADANVPVDGLVLEAVPRGRYRVQCSDQRHGAEDPAEFEVDSTDVDVTFEITMPRTSVATLTVYDETGALVRAGNLELRVSSSSGSREGLPNWVTPRSRKGANGSRTLGSHGVG